MWTLVDEGVTSDSLLLDSWIVVVVLSRTDAVLLY